MTLTPARDVPTLASEHAAARDERSMLVLEIATAVITLGSVLLLALGR